MIIRIGIKFFDCFDVRIMLGSLTWTISRLNSERPKFFLLRFFGVLGWFYGFSGTLNPMQSKFWTDSLGISEFGFHGSLIFKKAVVTVLHAISRVIDPVEFEFGKIRSDFLGPIPWEIRN